MALLSVLVVLALTACSDEKASLGAGPLGEGADGGDSGVICMPATDAGQYTFGTEVLANPAHQNAVLTSVELVEPDNFALKEARVVNVDYMSVGVQEWPPTRVDPARWESAVPLEGAVVPAGSAPSKNVVLHLSAPGGAPATLKAFKIRYKVGGKPYAMTTTYTFQVRPEC